MKSKINLSEIVNKLLLLVALLALNSCASRQEVVYFQDEPISEAIENQNANFELRYKTDDLLTIIVSADDPVVAQPYNLQAASTTTSVIDAQGSLKMQTYLIDSQGDIEFPGLGSIKIGGLTRSEANNLLKDRLKEYIKNPIVNIRLANFTVTVLGEVKNPGSYTIQDEKISISEALGLAGDLTIYGKRDNVLLIREVDGQKKYSKIDLTSVNVLNSANYYLTQNDVLYVEPNNARVRASSYNQNNGVIISAVGTLATIVAILIK
ncbi:polysaccharide biosynthesis/export family protein [Pontimicrobium aquaticum]|uniref:Polysaccharide export protein n=1 Tax=Pontimicrobium aquaticum TaxID=2565367 RepID=A0A4U0EPG2_9FLAO|nr:polysaccharide biosynthesis/export family protein [Pontimicrobium aquaticum]TJY33440.1 polysaccharide export protein [Pontimicrobium aquaticum]